LTKTWEKWKTQSKPKAEMGERNAFFVHWGGGERNEGGVEKGLATGKTDTSDYEKNERRNATRAIDE